MTEQPRLSDERLAVLADRAVKCAEKWDSYLLDAREMMAIITELRELRAQEKLVAMVHGKTCPKAPHTRNGYLHSPDDDRPYDVDGVSYCGRCHVVLP